jgi:penicillin-binding protein 1A
VKRPRSLLLRALGLSAFLAAAALLAAVAFVGFGLERLARSDVLDSARLSEPLRIYSADGLLMGEFGEERRRPVPFQKIPTPLVNAFLAAEDGRFYRHRGIDARGILRAALRNLQTGERAEGGSTISMQLARNLLLSREKTFERKLAEILTAVHLERILSKEEILTLYLNKIFFGHRAHGVAAAAALYYDKPLGELTLAQSAMLAGIPKAPTSNNPVTDKGRALARRGYVLGRMLELGFIDGAAYSAAMAEPDRAGLHHRGPELEAGYAAEMARRAMVERFGEEAYRGGYRVATTIDGRLQRAAQGSVRRAILDYDRRHGYRGPEARGQPTGAPESALDEILARAPTLPGLEAGVVISAGPREAEVYLGSGRRASLGLAQVKWARRFKTANQRGPAPRQVSDAVQAGDLVRLRRDAGGRWELSQTPGVAGALVALDPGDGAIRALVGGYHFGTSQFNRAVDARRQPGSAFKPFVYAAALDSGWTPADLILDTGIELEVAAGSVWEPRNFDGRTLGAIRLRRALTLSRNLASIDLLDRLGIDYVRRFAARFGFGREQLPRGLTLALGSGWATPRQMAGAYAVFANGGFRVEPHLISRVEDAAGGLAVQIDSPRACAGCWFRDADASTGPAPPSGATASAGRVLEPRLTYQMHSMLKDVIAAGTGRRAKALKRSDLAGKTGTTNDVRDAWFCGYHRDLVTVAWMGFDDYSPLGRGETGGESALGMWSGFMGEALAGVAEADLPVPPGMVQIWVDRSLGTPAGPGDRGAIPEWVPEELAWGLIGPDAAPGAVDWDATDGPPSPIIESVF